jgi:hypothetical protein
VNFLGFQCIFGAAAMGFGVLRSYEMNFIVQAILLFGLITLPGLIFAQNRSDRVPNAYSKLPVYAVSGNGYFWQAEQAVRDFDIEIQFVRGGGWYLVTRSQGVESHSWQSASGCKHFDLNPSESPRGLYKAYEHACDSVDFPGRGLVESIFRWLNGASSHYLDLKNCAIKATALSCKNGDFRLIADLQSGRLHRVQLRENATSPTLVLEIKELALDAQKLLLTPESRGLYSYDTVLTPDQVFTRAAAGDIAYAQKSVGLAMSMGYSVKPSELVYQALAVAYRAGLPEAAYYTAQFYSKNATFRPAALKPLGPKALRAELAKRMTEAAKDCEQRALQRMIEGCLEQDCAGESPDKATALTAHRFELACEARNSDRLKAAQRPAWSRREFAP